MLNQMEATKSLTPSQLSDFLLNVAPVRPIFIWGPPGIGKSSLVEQFAESVGMECVSLLGSQLAPEDIIGVPQIKDGKSNFCPPKIIAKEKAFCLFLDELNACSHEVQKAFYSLINDKRIGDFILPEGTIVIGAGNRVQDSAIVKPLSSALINRMIHISLRANAKDWLAWAGQNNVYPLVIEYLQMRPDHLWAKAPKHEEPFSTPRSWTILSECLHAYSKDSLNVDTIEHLVSGLIKPAHARQFVAFYKQQDHAYTLNAILKGEAKWPEEATERDILFFMVQSFRAQLIKNLPEKNKKLGAETKALAMNSKKLMIQLSRISLEMAQLVIAEDDQGRTLPDWYMMEISRDLPRLLGK